MSALNECKSEKMNPQEDMREMEEIMIVVVVLQEVRVRETLTLPKYSGRTTKTRIVQHPEEEYVCFRVGQSSLYQLAPSPAKRLMGWSAKYGRPEV